MTEKLYPELPNDIVPSAPPSGEPADTVRLVPLADVTSKLERNLSMARSREIELKMNELKKDLTRYQKVGKRWKKAATALKIISIVILGATTVVSIACGVTAALSPVFISIMAAIAAGESVLSGALILGLMKKKKKKYIVKITLIKEYIDKSYFTYQKMNSDGIITLEELQQFQALIKEYDDAANQLSEHHDTETDAESHNEISKMRESLKKHAESQARREIKSEIKLQIKNDYKEKLMHS
jgi:hypothetical protein